MSVVNLRSATNVGLAVRVRKDGKHIDRDNDAESTGVVSDMIPLGISLGVRVVLPMP